MARKSYDRMYREMDAKDYEKSIETPIEEVKEVIPEVKEDVKEEKVPSFIGTVIGGANLNVRNKPDGDIVTSLKEGTQVVIVGEDSDWYKIESPSKGYVMKKFVKV